ncbi:MAG: extracellular solute-binding protein, partial [Clostridiaceae bacterium]|nr:extracellular solute-binding protein [Clostridiaceae bacterium]
MLTVMVGALAGCSSSTSTDSEDTTTKVGITGSITASGSTALQPLADEAAKLFQEKNTKATVTVQGGGSGTGLKDAAAGNVQIGNSDVFADEKLPKDQAALLVDHKVCVVGFAAVVNDKVTVTNLTKEQLIDIFTGKIKNWKEVGGSDMKIVILNRPTSSGTRATFKKYALGGKDEAQGTALTEDSNGSISKTLKATDGSISYLASSFLNNDANKQGLKILQFGGVDMTP